MQHFRIATATDADELNELVNSAYRGDSSRQGWTTEADVLDGQRTDADGLRATIAAQGSVILLLHVDRKLLGCVNLQKRGGKAYLGMLTIRPGQQAGGLGKALLSEAEKWVVTNWQLNVIEMTVISRRTELIAWYERRGYRRTGRTEPFPYGDERFGIPKVKDLEFVVLDKQLS